MNEFKTLGGANDGRIIAAFMLFLRSSRLDRIALYLCLFVMVGELIMFKYYYPRMAFINGDSYKYLASAFYNDKISLYPIGYSRFLRLLSVFSNSDVTLFLFQYFFVQISSLFFLFSVFFFYPVNKVLKFLLVLVVSINPVVLYLSNYVSSDSIFVGLSVLWFTLLIWALKCPSLRLFVFIACVLFLAFTVRYSALYYPVVFGFALLLARASVRIKFISIGIGVVLVGGFVLNTSIHYKDLSGKFQFSPFSGWQMANNGLFAYRNIDSADRKSLPSKYSLIDSYVRRYFDTTKISKIRYPEEMIDLNAMYMWTPSTPLRKYMDDQFKGDTTIRELKKWSTVAPLFGDYGTELMKTYPNSFIKNYLWPNLVKYYVPPVEFLSVYGFRADTLSPIAQAWFGYPKNTVKSRFKDIAVTTLDVYPIIFGVMNAVFIMMSISFFILGGTRVDRELFRVWSLYAFFWVLNLVFSVFASPIALRFQVFPLLLNVVFNVVLLDFMLKQSDGKSRMYTNEKIPEVL